MPVQPAIGNLFQHVFDEIVPKLPLFCRALRHGFQRDFRRLAQPHDARDVFRARPALALLGAAMHERAQFQPLSDIQKADALGAA